MLPISAGSVAIQNTLVDYRSGRLDKVVAAVGVERFVAITGVTVDAPTDAIAAAAGFVEVVVVVEVVEAVDFDRRLADLCCYLNDCPCPTD